ncbi:hypothetical protein HK097_011380 [Rhizophlyctis rosea]|uniref:Uncharacterized protein n=1 Tax=Rhizophlyctis rosea TaxID=64517 RepID=A0AAD5SGS3_9FUNG|nr:hypothetical protein HK097_011380 [Rhizophlyctis rosea]
MEPELDEWSELEYANIRKHVGPNRLILSHVHPTLLANLPERIRPENGIVITEKPILDIEGVEKSKVILLDPQATEELVPEDGDNFEYFLFGGILELRVQGFATRHLGPVQMTTDTAVLVSQLVVEGRKRLGELPFVDRPEIKLGKKESVELPFRYIVEDGKPKLPAGLFELLKKSNDVSLI